MYIKICALCDGRNILDYNNLKIWFSWCSLFEWGIRFIHVIKYSVGRIRDLTPPGLRLEKGHFVASSDESQGLEEGF
jgi:hypothetical protein